MTAPEWGMPLKVMQEQAALIADLQADLARVTAERDAAEVKVARLVDALDDLNQWCGAYPLAVFPEPDFGRVAHVLQAAGMTIDAVSASNFRHVLKRVREITTAALSDIKEAPDA